MRDHSKECRSAEIVLYLYNKMKSGCICWEINKGSTGIGVESMIYEFENSNSIERIRCTMCSGRLFWNSTNRFPKRQKRQTNRFRNFNVSSLFHIKKGGAAPYQTFMISH